MNIKLFNEVLLVIEKTCFRKLEKEDIKDVLKYYNKDIQCYATGCITCGARFITDKKEKCESCLKFFKKLNLLDTDSVSERKYKLINKNKN